MALKGIAVAIILALIVNAIIFAFKIEPNHLQKDQWTWVDEVIVSYHKGEVSLFEALTWEFGTLAHSHILTLSTFMLNEQLFGLNLRVDTFIGMVSLIAVFAVFCLYIARLRLQPFIAGAIAATPKPYDIQRDIWFWGLLLLTASALFNIAVINAYNWSLVVFEHLYLFMAIGYLYLFDKMIRSGNIYKLAAIMGVVMMLGDAMGIAAVLASLVMLVLLIISDRHYVKPALILLGVFVFLAIFGKLFLTGERVHDVGSMSETLKYAIANPSNVYSFFTKGIGRGWFAFHVHHKIQDVKAIDLTGMIGLAGILFGATMAISTLLKKRLEENIFPVLLIGFSLICVIGAVKLRLLTGVASYMYGDRYYRFLLPFMLGSFILLYSLWTRRPSKVLTGIFATFVGLHVFTTYMSSDFIWNKASGSVTKFYGNWDTKLGEYARGESDEYPSVNPQCRKRFCRESVDFLYSRDSLQNIDNPDLD